MFRRLIRNFPSYILRTTDEINLPADTGMFLAT